jgi:hypothetical protein
MIDWLIAANEKCRDIAQKSRDALSALEKKDADGAKRIQDYMKADYKTLVGLWEQVDPTKSDAGRLSDMGRPRPGRPRRKQLALKSCCTQSSETSAFRSTTAVTCENPYSTQ